MTIQQITKTIDTKPSWGKNEVLQLLNQIPESTNIKRVRHVEEIKKYDIVYVQTMQGAHYVLVHRVKDGIVYGLVLSSKEECHNLLKIEKDRYFLGNFITKSYLCWDLEVVKKSFCRVIENKKEADQAFKLAKEFYKEALSIR